MSSNVVVNLTTERPMPSASVLGAGALMVLAVAVLYRSVFPSWASDLWNDPNYSHGLIVPFVALWLAYERRNDWIRLSPHPARSALALILGGIVLLLLGGLAAEVFVMRMSLLLLGTGLLAFVFGYAYVRALALPLAFLLFMVPLPSIVLNEITLPLQFVASEMAVTFLHWLALPALREGNVIVLPNGALEVAEACSGVRSLISLGAMSVVVAVLTLRRPLLQGLLVASSVAIAVLTNGLRIAGTGVLAYVYNPTVAEGFFHGFSGWMVFVVALVLLGLEAGALQPWDRRRGA
jgi:exosortase